MQLISIVIVPITMRTRYLLLWTRRAMIKNDAVCKNRGVSAAAQEFICMRMA
jgi:hypothetical protein